MEYRITVGGQLIVTCNWQPMAEAAWHRATRNEDGGAVELYKDGRLISRVMPERGRGHRWPDGPECGMQDIVRALLLLLRDDEWDVKEIAEAMTASGLPTSRARVDAMRGGSGRRATISPAEVVVMISAVLDAYRKK